jgi:two-component system CheB/CheR fusion protein
VAVDVNLVQLLDACEIPSLVVDGRLEILNCTPSVGRMLEVSLDEAAGSLESLAQLVDNADLVDFTRRAVASLTTAEHAVITPSGRYVLLRMLPRASFNGQSPVSLVTIIDITKHRNATKDAAQAGMRLHVGSVGHDLRQPVQTISLLNTALLQVAGDAQIRKIALAQREALDQMRVLLDTLLQA